MDFVSGWSTWALFFAGSGVVVSGSYVLGRIDALRRVKRLRPTWVAVSNHGPFGLEPADQFRSRVHAESYRRRLAGVEKIEVMSYEAWRDAVLAQLQSDSYWDEIERIENWVKDANARIIAAIQQATTVLPQIEQGPTADAVLVRLDSISSEIGVISARIDRADEALAESTRMMDAFREHIVHLDEVVTTHTAKVGHITAEMKVITDDAEELRKNSPTKEFPRPTGPTVVRAPRGVVRVGRSMEKDRSDHESGPESVEG